ETILFFFLNGVGLAIQAGAVALAKYGFGTTHPFTLNLVNVVSIGVAMIFRFWSYRRWVWRVVETPTEAEPGTAPAEPSELTPSR
ncbi:MAG TPA: GtrA family protein, partial [Mycobacteriales bacterium]|nr:GtrA family protein [Mycobacteriales bacterium]